MHLSPTLGARAGRSAITPRILSLLAHSAAVAVLVYSGLQPPKPARPTERTPFIPVALEAFRPTRPLPIAKTTNGGSVGGGANEHLPAPKGDPPPPVTKPYIPPTTHRPEQAALVLEPAAEVMPEMRMQQPIGTLGQLESLSRLPSDGPGRRGGIGEGERQGVGARNGNGFGPNSGSGISGAATSPTVLFQSEPEYTDRARQAKLRGVVTLQIVVDESGHAQQIRVLSPLGLGLDEAAVEAVRKWRFRPARRDGRPVAVPARIDVHFNLL